FFSLAPTPTPPLPLSLHDALPISSYSSMAVRLADSDAFDRFRADIDVDPRLANEAKREQQFYSDQSKALSAFINILGLTLTTIRSEEHTSELQSRRDLVCRLLLEE